MKKILSSLAAILFSLSLFISPVSAKEGFVLEHYDIQIEVSEDGIYTVTETINARFHEKLHGIVLSIPQRYENVKWTINDQVINRNYTFPINNVEILSDHEAETSTEDNNLLIRLGSANSYVNQNEEYIVRYQVNSRDLKLDGIQSFYYNLVSSYWDTTIENVSFRITMPKSFDASKLSIYTNLNENQYKVQVVNNLITGQSLAPLYSREGFTIKLDLPDNYFTFAKPLDPTPYVTGISLFLLIVAIGLYMKFGVDEKVIVTVEFTAPNDISSAEVGYIQDGSIDDRDLISLLLDWANRGYLSIKETEEDALELTKLQDIDQRRPMYEKRMFQALFKKNNVITTKELNEKFYVHMTQAKQDLHSYFNQPENLIFTKTSGVLQVFLALVCTLPLAGLVAYQWYSWFYDGLGIFIGIVVLLLGLATCGTLCWLQLRWRSAKPGLRLGACIGVLVLMVILAVITLTITVMCNGSLLLVGLNFVILEILFLLCCFMGKRTSHGTLIYGRVLGLSDFIQTAEAERLVMLVKEDPHYFYSILPYAYAMGFTDLWAQHFKNLSIEPPTWYVGSGDLTTIMMIHHLNRSMNTLNQTMTSFHIEDNGSGRGGSFGGGGGGGFTGGGFGGSSGSGW